MTAIAHARLDRDWNPKRGHDLLVVDCCPFCAQTHHYMTWAPSHPGGGAIGNIVAAHCRDNPHRNRADRRYILVAAVTKIRPQRPQQLPLFQP